MGIFWLRAPFSEVMGNGSSFAPKPSFPDLGDVGHCSGGRVCYAYHHFLEMMRVLSGHRLRKLSICFPFSPLLKGRSADTQPLCWHGADEPQGPYHPAAKGAAKGVWQKRKIWQKHQKSEKVMELLLLTSFFSAPMTLGPQMAKKKVQSQKRSLLGSSGLGGPRGLKRVKSESPKWATITLLWLLFNSFRALWAVRAGRPLQTLFWPFRHFGREHCFLPMVLCSTLQFCYFTVLCGPTCPFNSNMNISPLSKIADRRKFMIRFLSLSCRKLSCRSRIQRRCSSLQVEFQSG